MKKPQKKTIKAWAIVDIYYPSDITSLCRYGIFKTKRLAKLFLKEKLRFPESYKIVRCTITYEI